MNKPTPIAPYIKARELKRSQDDNYLESQRKRATAKFIEALERVNRKIKESV